MVRKLPIFQSEAELFRQVSLEKGILSRAIVEDHPGPGVYQRAGGFVGRCISVGKSVSEVNRQLRKKEAEVKASFRPWHH